MKHVACFVLAQFKPSGASLTTHRPTHLASYLPTRASACFATLFPCPNVYQYTVLIMGLSFASSSSAQETIESNYETLPTPSRTKPNMDSMLSSHLERTPVCVLHLFVQATQPCNRPPQWKCHNTHKNTEIIQMDFPPLIFTL